MHGLFCPPRRQAISVEGSTSKGPARQKRNRFLPGVQEVTRCPMDRIPSAFSAFGAKATGGARSQEREPGQSVVDVLLGWR